MQKARYCTFITMETATTALSIARPRLRLHVRHHPARGTVRHRYLRAWHRHVTGWPWHFTARSGLANAPTKAPPHADDAAERLDVRIARAVPSRPLFERCSQRRAERGCGARPATFECRRRRCTQVVEARAASAARVCAAVDAGRRRCRESGLATPRCRSAHPRASRRAATRRRRPDARAAAGLRRESRGRATRADRRPTVTPVQVLDALVEIPRFDVRIAATASARPRGPLRVALVRRTSSARLSPASALRMRYRNGR